MRLPEPTPTYSEQAERERNREIEAADAQNHKRNRDVEIGSQGRLILTDTATGTRYEVHVTSGTLGITSL